MAPEKILDLVGVKPTNDSPNTYISLSNPSQMGNRNKIAYGGCALANLIHAAYTSLPSPKYHLYSALGNYLGPTQIDRKIICTVHPFRTTRTFYTCRVEARQVQNDGTERAVMMALLDFQVSEPALLTYSAPPTGPPTGTYSHYSSVPDAAEQRAQKIKAGTLEASAQKMSTQTLGLMARFWEQRPCPEGLWSQNACGMDKKAVTSQDHLPLTAKTSGDWYRLRETASADCPGTHFAAMGWLMDAALSFIPLTHNHQFLDDAGACSSLDFALRFFVSGDQLDAGKWHFREMKTINGAGGRTYSEAQLWDEKGDMVASMTQQSILRPKPVQKL